MIRLVLFVEEESMKVLLKGFLSRLGLAVEPRVISFNGKHDLQKKVGDKMRRYDDEPGVEPRFIVMQDGDNADCRAVKARLVTLCEASGRAYRVRVVMQEMEAWILGDLRAVAAAYNQSNALQEAGRARFRDPDLLPKPSEALTEITGDGRKVGRALRIGPYMDPAANISGSFRAFCDAVRILGEIE